MPAAVTALMLRAGTTVHLEMSDFYGLFNELPQLLDERDDTPVSYTHLTLPTICSV